MNEHPTDVWGALLAAGTSSRFGDHNKLLAEIEGKPMVRHSAETLVNSKLAGVVVVVGYEADKVRTTLDGLDVTVRENEAYETGQSTSVRVGVAEVAERGANAVLIALGDMPDVSTQTIDSLLAAYADGAGKALAATYDGERGNPVLFDRRHFDELTSITGDVGGREVFLRSSDAALVETNDPGVRCEVDTAADLSERTGE